MSEASSFERALAEIERLKKTIAEQDVKRAQLQRELAAAAPVMLTVIALLNDEVDLGALRGIGVWYSNHEHGLGHDLVRVWLDHEERLGATMEPTEERADG